MKKSVTVVSIIFIVIIILIGFYFIGVKNKEEFKINDSKLADEGELDKNIITESNDETKNTSQGLPNEIKEEFKIFDPVLKYEGAYNGPLYATWEHASYKDANSYFNNLDRNGINFIVGAFSISEKQSADTLISSDGLGKIIYLAQKYPHRIVPVFSTGVGGAEEKIDLGDKLTGIYKNVIDSSNMISKGTIKGFGEIETQEWPTPHDSQKIMQLFSLANSNDIFVMFHPVTGQKEAIKNIAQTYPNTIFLIHMFPEDFSKERSNIIDLLKTHDNLYFSINTDHMLYDGQTGLLYKYEDRTLSSAKSSFISDFDSKQNSLLNTAVSRYKPLVDAVPDKVMWGTEASQLYNFEPEVYDRAIKFSRMFIGKLNPEHQEMIAYKNALGVFGEGVVLDREINVYDTGSWPLCTDEQLEECEVEMCGLQEGEYDLSPEQEECFKACLFETKCVDPLA